ncbi:MAG: ArgR family transcriptional regulator [Coriobacteriales bacterium]|jgi:transcriptional regulator of arginine metabolism|nr:ArgR family transcriptional regulator [Coriobacteriales bacterium]
MKKRDDRYEAIREIVRSRHISTQSDLAESLKEWGFSCTQATISRDIANMGLHKLSSGIYMLAEDMRLQRMVSDLVDCLTVTGNLVVVKTSTGAAQGVAAALDAANLPSILGSIAGDDTILVIATDEDHAAAFEATLNRLRLN